MLRETTLQHKIRLFDTGTYIKGQLTCPADPNRWRRCDNVKPPSPCTSVPYTIQAAQQFNTQQPSADDSRPQILTQTPNSNFNNRAYQVQISVDTCIA